VPSAAAITARAMTESSGNPSAVNNWDSNAAAGTPSEGLMQMIQPTFDSYALSGHTDIMNPVDNIVAAVRYANATYGAFENIAYGTSGY
jgi:SLT domain-containing protein